ncbi:hypothetical protein [Billgrantia gudaonensis]|uniref:DUF4136 domain-containing protein n=1 Tax=Billgrantia gudaonensis TaxID=376427 RepID=A0A1G8Z3I3_9GAMM|nr:hypothetical protein [Halomonas gudaonensis]SDK09563.1 hypothetical protein SAMN04487954_11179 [Halomonas gudaonensis]
MIQRWLLPALLVLPLVGCQSPPSRLPVAEPPPAAECHWQVPGAAPSALVRAAVAALEAEDFVIRDTDLTLGLVSADRTERIPSYRNPHDDWAEPTWYGRYGVGSRGWFTGMSVGFGGGGPFDRDATRLERVSLVADGDWVRVSRDLQVIDWRGTVRESRSASDAAFCRDLRRDLAVALSGETP